MANHTTLTAPQAYSMVSIAAISSLLFPWLISSLKGHLVHHLPLGMLLMSYNLYFFVTNLSTVFHYSNLFQNQNHKKNWFCFICLHGDL